MLSVAMAIQLITDLCVQIHHHTWVVRHEWLLPVVALLLLLSVVQGPIHRIISGKAKHDVARSVVCVTGCDSGFGLYMSRKMKELGYIPAGRDPTDPLGTNFQSKWRNKLP